MHICPYGGCHRSKIPFKSERDLERHFDRVHGTERYFCANHNCRRSRKGFTNKDSLLRHMYEVHNVESNYPRHGVDRPNALVEDSAPVIIAALVHNEKTGTEEWMNL